MKTGSIYNIIIFILTMVGICGCYELDNDYSTSPNLRLSFSTDTVAFDTVFTSVGSATRQFMIYNRNSSALLIQSIRLKDATSAGFRFNVDGRKGSSFTDVRIAGNDSMYVFVEVTAEPTGDNQPVLIENRLEFTVNNAQQYVVLQASGLDVVKLRGGFFVDRDTVWKADRPYLVYDSVVVGAGVNLEIEKGAVFYMHDKAKWVVNGSIIASGELESPIVFRGDRLDYAINNIPYDRLPAQWDGLYFGAESFGNTLDFVVVKNGQHGIVCHESTPEKTKLQIANSLITNTAQSVFEAVNCNIKAVNTEFSNSSSGAVVSLTGGCGSFIHCTLVNFYKYFSRIPYPVLSLSNFIETGDERRGIDLNGASFYNSIIDGSLWEGDKALEGELKIDRMEGFGLDFSFNHCAVKTKEIEDTCFVAVRFITAKFAPVYVQTGGEDNDYVYDYRPKINVDKDKNPLDPQPVVWQADTTVSVLYPYDRLGVKRLVVDGKAPDTGAYEHINESEQNQDNG